MFKTISMHKMDGKQKKNLTFLHHVLILRALSQQTLAIGQGMEM